MSREFNIKCFTVFNVFLGLLLSLNAEAPLVAPQGKGQGRWPAMHGLTKKGEGQFMNRIQQNIYQTISAYWTIS